MSSKDKKTNRKQIDIPDFINYEEVKDSDVLLRKLKTSLADQVEYMYEEDDGRRRKRRVPRLISMTVLVLLVLTALSGLLMFTKPGQKVIVNLAGNYIYGTLDYDASEDAVEAGTKDTDNAIPKIPYEESDPVINILLVGIEEINGARNTDSMIVATMNTKDHSFKLTSLMRDLYVDIPGYDKNKLNSAFAKGGINLLYKTIETNFQINIDGYCMVNFEAFEQIVDMVGGIEITLTKDEAKYLNTTNYISKKSNRKVVAGTQLMNGNQALGYCRVRYVSTGTENNDFGRTQRQRIVLQAIYDKVKSKNIVSLVMLMNNILNNVEIKTDIRKNEFNSYLQEAINIRGAAIQTLRIPTDKSYTNAKVQIGSRKVDVLELKDWNATRKELHDYIYGKGTE